MGQPERIQQLKQRQEGWVESFVYLIFRILSMKTRQAH